MWLSSLVDMNSMSMPRRAMKEMGLQACCLWCDAPDLEGLPRCTPCIERHKSIRETLAKASPDDGLAQFAKEVLMMAASPHKFDHLEGHGPVLHQQQKIAASMLGERRQTTQDEVEALFELQSQVKKTNVIQDFANKNEWKDKAPTAEEAHSMAELHFSDQVEQNPHARTNPSKPIQQIDRSDRIGEDVNLTYRLQAQQENPFDEVLVDLEVESKKKIRKTFLDAVASIDELLDDED